MRHMKKLASVLLALVMMMALSLTAFAQTADTAQGGQATITVSNASKGETYKVYKLFDATVNGKTGEESSIAYTGTIPDSLSAYFEKDSAGNISLKDGVNNTDLFAALKTWTESATATATAVSDGSALTFSGLQYGYYVVTSTQGEMAITVTSTNPTATVVDKNSTTPIKDLKKTADSENVNIGDTVTYTVEFSTASYTAAGKQIVSYTIKDTLPKFLTDVTVTGITIDGTAYTVNGAAPQFENGTITIPWASNGTNLYKNGAKIVVTYTATVTDSAAIDGEGNKNEVTISYTDTDGGQGTDQTESETIYTYAIAIKKVNEKGENLAGATFQLPFYVKTAKAADGSYVYGGTAAGDGLTNTVTTPADGLVIIKGVAAGTYTLSETAAPAGYNLLTNTVSVEAQKTGATTTKVTKYLDENGNVTDTETNTSVTVTADISAGVLVVVNSTGSELPSTGGMGTTLLYTVGTILVLAAGVLLVVRRRMSIEK